MGAPEQCYDLVSSGHTRTVLPRARNTGAAISCSCTTTRTFSGKGNLASLRRRASFAANSLATSGFKVSTASTSFPARDVGAPQPDKFYRGQPVREEYARVHGPCLGPFANRWRSSVPPALLWRIPLHTASLAPLLKPLPTKRCTQAEIGPAHPRSGHTLLPRHNHGTHLSTLIFSPKTRRSGLGL
jgi:hypothetical protein